MGRHLSGDPSASAPRSRHRSAGVAGYPVTATDARAQHKASRGPPGGHLSGERSVARRLDVVGPLLEHLGVDLLSGRIAVLLVELTGQRVEVRLVSAVLQVASDLRLLGFCTAAPHRVSPLAHSAGAPVAPGLSQRVLVSTTLPAGWLFPHTPAGKWSEIGSPAAEGVTSPGAGRPARRFRRVRPRPSPRRRPRRGCRARPAARRLRRWPRAGA